MKINLTGVDMKVADSLQEKVEKKLEKFHRFFGDETNCMVKFQPEKGNLKVELTLKIRRDLYRAEAVGPQAEIAIDAAVDTLERQIRKHKTKMKKKKHQYGYMKDYMDQLDEEAEETAARITKHKQFAIEPMDDEEAAMQMELMGHDFHVYLSADTGKVCVLYKRRDGDYGVLEPEY